MVMVDLIVLQSIIMGFSYLVFGRNDAFDSCIKLFLCKLFHKLVVVALAAFEVCHEL